MQLPEQDEFFDFFAANDDEQASLRRKFFLEKHKEPWLSESALEDYQALFMSIYGINIDWKEGILACLRHFQIIRERSLSRSNSIMIVRLKQQR